MPNVCLRVSQPVQQGLELGAEGAGEGDGLAGSGVAEADMIQ